MYFKFIKQIPHHLGKPSPNPLPCLNLFVWVSYGKSVTYILLCPSKSNSKQIELTVHTSCYLGLRLTLWYKLWKIWDFVYISVRLRTIFIQSLYIQVDLPPHKRIVSIGISWHPFSIILSPFHQIQPKVLFEVAAMPFPCNGN